MRKVSHLGAFTKSTRDIINANFLLAGFGTVGTVIYCDPANGYDNSAEVNNPDKPFKTLAGAYAAATSGKNDVIVLVSDGAATGTARVDTAITWAKNATHLIGLGAPSRYGQRARIAPTTTTVGASTNKDYITVSGRGCYFANLQIWGAFATGIAASIALTVSGANNTFENCHIVGLADAASAADTASYCLKVSASENYFKHCVIGTDTVLRTAANASVLFSGGAARTVFEDCVFPVYTSSTSSLIASVPAASPNGSDRETIFENCKFLNMLNLTSVATMLEAFNMVANGINGYFLIKDCVRVNITNWGDTATLLRLWLSGAGDEAQAGDEVGRAHVGSAS